MQDNKNLLLKLEEDWLLIHDKDNKGREECWYKTGVPTEHAVKASVPGYVHLYMPDCFGIAWYQKRFTDTLKADENQAVLLRFAVADYLCEVYLNGSYVGSHRGCEDPFEFNVTSFLNKGGENMLCVRVAKPHESEVDGYRFEEIPHRNERKTGIWPGMCFNVYGLGGAVSLIAMPKIHMTDAYIMGNTKTNCIDIEVTVQNDSEDCTCALRADCGNKRTGELQKSASISFEAVKGESKVKLSVPIEQVQRWSIVEPFLYFVNLTLTGIGCMEHTLRRHCGFREFLVKEDGYFYLNGKRIFLRCSHTGNFFPIGQTQPINPDLWRQDFIKAKACGLNTIRFISGAAFPEQLDYCDELGLMVYEEPYAGWLTQNGSRSKEIYQEDLLTMVKRDRSHPSLTIWGLLNETVPTDPYGDYVKIARESLEDVRRLDETRLVLFSSGRFDGDAFVGSLSNPYSRKWECLWNEEDENSTTHTKYEQYNPGGYFEMVGDVHMYPKLPISDHDINLIRTLGSKTGRPVFMSEFGIGSLFNTDWLMRKFEQLKANPDLPDARMIKHMNDQFLRDIKLYGLEGLYAFPIDILRDSERLHARQRTICFDLVRSNPLFNGYSITGLLDHSICGEGLWTLMREFKPLIADTLQNGLAPLRWCLFVERRHAYTKRPFTIEGVLANEDVLEERSYPVGVRIMGESGIVYDKTLTLKVTKDLLKGFAVPVFKEEIILDVPAGRYELHAEILEGAAACENVSVFYLSNYDDIKATTEQIVGVSLNEQTQKLLSEKGIEVITLKDSDVHVPAVVLVGDVADEDKETVFAKINAMAQAGSRVFVASRFSLTKGEEYCHYLPFEDKPDSYPHNRVSADWLYHKEYIAKRHEYFEGLPCGRIMDWEYYMQLVGGSAFRDGRMPDEVQAACVGTGNINANGYDGGFNLGTYNIGKGAVTVTSFKIVENIGDNPAADRLLINILNTEAKKLKSTK